MGMVHTVFFPLVGLHAEGEFHALCNKRVVNSGVKEPTEGSRGVQTNVLSSVGRPWQRDEGRLSELDIVQLRRGYTCDVLACAVDGSGGTTGIHDWQHSLLVFSLQSNVK